MRHYLQEHSIDVVVTSPPYNIGVAYASYIDNQPKDKFLSWLAEIALEIKRILTNEGSFFLNVGGKPSDPWVPFDILQKLRKHFVLQNVIHWIKSIALSKDREVFCNVSYGHYKPIGGQRFLNDCHEYIFHFTNSGKVKLDRLAIGVPYQDKSNIGRWKAAVKDKRCRGNTWFIPYETIQSRERDRPHPSSFPVKLPEMCIKLHGVSNTTTVLDPFLGLGSTALACLRLGISFVGFEIDPHYFQLALKRIQEFANSRTLFWREYGSL